MSGISNAAPISWQHEIQSTNQRPPLGPGHRTLGRALAVLLAACAGVSVLQVMLDLYGLTMINGWEADPSNILLADVESYDAVDLGLARLQLLVMLATGISTMTWLYQAYGSREADPALLPYKRWWTIGGWLIPFISLVRPLQLMQDLYRATASAQPQERPDASVRCPARFGCWCACWLLVCSLSYVAARYGSDDPDLGQLRTAVSLDLVTEVITIAAAVLFMGVLRSITSNLWRRANA